MERDKWKWEKMGEFVSLVVLLCTSRGCQFQATENATKSQNTTLKHMVSYHICLGLVSPLTQLDQRPEEARRNNIPAFFSLSEPDKLFIRGRLWPVGKKLIINPETVS